MKRFSFLFVLVSLAYAGRYYDSEVGIFTSVDPAGEFFNAYSYTGGNPVLLIDPNGFLTYNSQNSNWTLDPGDDLNTVASDVGITFDELAAANPGWSVLNWQAGSVVNIPQLDRIQAYQWAVGNIGNADYGYNGNAGGYVGWKCNLFVSHAYTLGAGISDYPQRYRFFIPRGPVNANTLASNQASVGPMTLTTSPKLGDISAWSNQGGLGHTMIKGLYGNYIGAGQNTVVRRNSSYMTTHGYTNPTYRTYNP